MGERDLPPPSHDRPDRGGGLTDLGEGLTGRGEGLTDLGEGLTGAAPEPARLYTVGHGARPAAMLVEVLREAGVGLVWDIRRFPGSRRHPQFGREVLAGTLAEAGIGYEGAGAALGGRRSRSDTSRHTALRNRAFAGYADHMDTGGFRAAVARLQDRAAAVPLAIMCAETPWWRCHRMLVADALVMRGVDVVHLLEPGRRQPHRPHPAARRGDDGWPVYDVATR